jgi:hypothetical protein
VISAIALVLGLAGEHSTNVIALALLAAIGALLLLWTGVERSPRLRRPGSSGGA